MKHLPTLTACALLLAAAAARAAAPFQEDLSSVTLPHGDLILPLPATLEAGNGTLLNFSDGKLHTLPTNMDKPIAPADLPAVIQKNKTADLAFLDSDNGTLWAISGRISELGITYLADAAAMTLDPPLEMPGDKSHPAGLFKGVGEGKTYLVQDTAGKFALVRIIELSPVGAHIQYVYQPDGTTHFPPLPKALADSLPITPLTSPLPAGAVPGPTPAGLSTSATPALTAAAAGAGLTVPATPGPAAFAQPTQNPAQTPAAQTPAAPAAPHSLAGMTLRMNDPPATPVLEPDMATFLRQRDSMIQTRLKEITAPATTPAQVARKSDEIAELGALRATEAADTLAAQISFLDPYKQAKDTAPETIHPAYASLLALGKPGADAALKALRSLGLTPPPGGTQFTDTPDYRAHLLALVVRNVDGDDIADYLFKKEMARTPDPKKRALYQSLLGETP